MLGSDGGEYPKNYNLVNEYSRQNLNINSKQHFFILKKTVISDSNTKQIIVPDSNDIVVRQEYKIINNHF